MKILDRVRSFFGMHVHERELFLIGKYALVKCVTCGSESIPWEPSSMAIVACQEWHKDDAKKIREIDERIAQSRGGGE